MEPFLFSFLVIPNFDLVFYRNLDHKRKQAPGVYVFGPQKNSCSESISDCVFLGTKDKIINSWREGEPEKASTVSQANTGAAQD